MTRDEYNMQHQLIKDVFVMDMYDLYTKYESCTEDCALASWGILCRFKNDLDDLYSDYMNNQA